MKYKILVDVGIPFEIECNDEVELKDNMNSLKRDYADNPDYPCFDAFVFDEYGREITDSQFIEEMICEMMED